MRRFASLVVAAVLLAAAMPALADVTPADVEAARQQVREVTARLEDQVRAYDAAVAAEAQLRDRLDRLRVELTARERQLSDAQADARSRVVSMYMQAGLATEPDFVTSGDLSEIPARLAYLDTVVQTDREVVTRLEAARADYRRQQTLLVETVAAQEAARAEIEALVGGIYGELEDANAAYQAVSAEWERQEEERRRREEEERRRQEFLATSTTEAPTTTQGGGGGTATTRPSPTTTTGTTLPPAPKGTLVCPVDGAVTFTDTWGAPRPGGRSHTGVDMMAATGTPLVAIENGTIWYMSTHYAGGIGIYVRGESGDIWYYAHMQKYASGMATGKKVSAGQRVGFVGSTGNASVPHLHLGWQPDGGRLANAYSTMKKLC